MIIKHLVLAACGLSLLNACEAEYPQRKKTKEEKQNPLDGNSTQNGDDNDQGDGGGNTNGDGNTPGNGDQAGTTGDQTNNNGNQSTTGTQTGTGNNQPSTNGNNTNNGTQTATNNGNTNTTPNKNEATSTTLNIKQFVVCKNTALISLENGRTNCFLKTGTQLNVSSAKATAETFVVVSIAEKQHGCTMTSGALYLPHVAKDAGCDSSPK